MKSKLRLLVMVSALLTGINSAVAQPMLGIIATNNQAVLFWTANAGGTNGVLESSASLFSSNWSSVTDTIPVNYASHTAVAVNPSSSVRFFRLMLVPPTADGMALIPVGSLTIGDTLDGESDAIPTNDYVSAFYMDTNLVSYTQWQLVYNWATNRGYGFEGPGIGKGTDYPQVVVDWYDCVIWCNARSQKAGLTPVYYTDANLTQVYTNDTPYNSNTVYANWAASGYRLPTEAEWEKAARGGLTRQRFPFGNTISEVQADYFGNSDYYSYDFGPNGYNAIGGIGGPPCTSPVGAFPANGYGLYDMAGNVLEWCWDWYAGPPYPTGSPYLGGTDPRGPASSPNDYRVLRGGDWSLTANYARCANRSYYSPGYRFVDIGFRCVRVQ